MPAVDIVIDAGQTGVRLGVAHAGQVTQRHEIPGLTYRGRQAESVLAALATARPAIDPDAPVRTVCIGLTSVLGDDREYRDFAHALAGQFNAGRALVTGDIVTAHAGALRMRPGVVLAAGTGAIALGVEADGRCQQVDGLGYLLGDAGGGFWIGRRGLEAAMRGHDGRAPAGPLTTQAAAVLGDLGTLAERIYPTPDGVATIAAFARDVLELADQDARAAAILAEAATELAGTVLAACPTPGEPVAVSWTGRLLQHEGLRRRFVTELAHRNPAACCVPATGDGLAGAAWLAAAAELGPYAPLIRVVTR